MRARWIFLLLCAILVQVNISDSFVDEHGYELNTMPYNLTGEQFSQGDVINDTELSSETGKIRRVRSLEEEMARAKTEMESQQLAMKAAKAHAKEAKTKEEEGIRLWNEANANLTTITTALSIAMDEQSNATKTLQTANETVVEKQEEVEEAEGEFIVVNLIYESLKIKEKTKNIDFTDKEKAFDSANAAQQDAFVREADAYNNLTEKQELLEKCNDKLKELTEKYVIAYNKSRDDNQTISDDDMLIALKAEEKEAEQNRTTCVNNNDTATTKKRELVSKKGMIDANDILNGINRDDWQSMTVDEAIVQKTESVKTLKAELNGSDTQPAKTNLIGDEHTLGKLIELKNKLNFTGKEKVKDHLNTKDKLLVKVGKDIAREDTKIEEATKEITKYDENIKIMAEYLKNLTAEMDLEYDSKLGNKAKLARKNQEATTTKLIEEAERVAKKKLEIELLPAEITNLNTTYLSEANYLYGNDTALEAAKSEKEYAKGNWTEAKRVAKKWSTDEVTPASVAKERADRALTSAKDVVGSASSVASNSETIVRKKNIQKEEAIKIVKEKEEEKDKLKKKHDLFVEILADAQKKVNQAEENFSALQRQAGNEEERKSKMAAIGWGLGGTLFVLVLVAIAGILVFIIIRRRKKIVKEKKPTRIEFRLENGLTCIRREGQPDQHVVKGEDFKIMGPLVRAKVSNTVPTKHLLDDQVGGDKIDGPLSFPPHMNEAYFIGEGVEINIDDSVSIKANTPQDPEAGLLDGLDQEWLEARMKEVEDKYPEYNAQRKKSGPSSSEEKNSDEKKPDEKKKSTKDNRPIDSKPKNASSDPAEGEKKAAKSPMK